MGGILELDVDSDMFWSNRSILEVGFFELFRTHHTLSFGERDSV